MEVGGGERGEGARKDGGLHVDSGRQGKRMAVQTVRVGRRRRWQLVQLHTACTLRGMPMGSVCRMQSTSSRPAKPGSVTSCQLAS